VANTVVGQGVGVLGVLQLLAVEHKALLVERDAHLGLDVGLDCQHRVTQLGRHTMHTSSK
jgi:hypothetical protein